VSVFGWCCVPPLFADSVLCRYPDPKGEQRFVTLGMDALGRVLVVIHSPRESRTRLISARKASNDEAEPYHA
jgi:uncharacterized DUF497 family protein